jgi:hypothetical protein
MDARLRQQIREHMTAKETADLLKIWNENDAESYSLEAFDVVRELLRERGEDVPDRQAAKPRVHPKLSLFMPILFVVFVLSIVVSVLDTNRRLSGDFRRAELGDRWLESAVWWDRPAFRSEGDESWHRDLTYITVANPDEVFDIAHVPRGPMTIYKPDENINTSVRGQDITELRYTMYRYARMPGSTVFIWEKCSDEFSRGGLVKTGLGFLLLCIMSYRASRRWGALQAVRPRLVQLLAALLLSASLGALASWTWAITTYDYSLTLQRLVDSGLTAFVIVGLLVAGDVIRHTWGEISSSKTGKPARA